VAARKLLQRKLPLSPDPDNKGCYLYRASASDTIGGIASTLGLSESDVKDRNSVNIQDFSRLNGRFIQLCNIRSECRVMRVHLTSIYVHAKAPPLRPISATC